MQGVLIDDHRIYVDFSQSVCLSATEIMPYGLTNIFVRSQNCPTRGGLAQMPSARELPVVVGLEVHRNSCRDDSTEIRATAGLMMTGRKIATSLTLSRPNRGSRNLDMIPTPDDHGRTATEKGIVTIGIGDGNGVGVGVGSEAVTEDVTAVTAGEAGVPTVLAVEIETMIDGDNIRAASLWLRTVHRRFGNTHKVLFFYYITIECFPPKIGGCQHAQPIE